MASGSNHSFLCYDYARESGQAVVIFPTSQVSDERLDLEQLRSCLVAGRVCPLRDICVYSDSFTVLFALRRPHMQQSMLLSGF